MKSQKSVNFVSSKEKVSASRIFKDRKVLVLGSFAILFVVTLFVWGIVGIVSYVKGKNTEINTPLVTNITDTSTTIVWTTNEEIPGSVVVSKEDNIGAGIFASLGRRVFHDDRDVVEVASGEYQPQGSKSRKTHHVTIRGLEPETLYYFKIKNGSAVKDTYLISNFKTAKTEDKIATPEPVYGEVVGSNVDQAEGIVILEIADGVNREMDKLKSTKVSTYLSNGTYSLDLGNVYKADLSEKHPSPVGNDKYYVRMEVISPGHKYAYHSITNDKYQPVDKIILKEGNEVESYNKYWNIGGEESMLGELVSPVFAQGCNSHCIGDCQGCNDETEGNPACTTYGCGYMEHCCGWGDSCQGHCGNGFQDCEETGVDCGGGGCHTCGLDPATPPENQPPQTKCTSYKDGSKVDPNPATGNCGCSVNGKKDSDEGSVDCGGHYCPSCEENPGSHCFNGTKDADETGLDCGGSCNAKCSTGAESLEEGNECENEGEIFECKKNNSWYCWCDGGVVKKHHRKDPSKNYSIGDSEVIEEELIIGCPSSKPFTAPCDLVKDWDALPLPCPNCISSRVYQGELYYAAYGAFEVYPNSKDNSQCCIESSINHDTGWANCDGDWECRSEEQAEAWGNANTCHFAKGVTKDHSACSGGSPNCVYLMTYACSDFALPEECEVEGICGRTSSLEGLAPFIDETIALYGTAEDGTNCSDKSKNGCNGGCAYYLCVEKCLKRGSPKSEVCPGKTKEECDSYCGDATSVFTRNAQGYQHGIGSYFLCGTNDDKCCVYTKEKSEHCYCFKRWDCDAGKPSECDTLCSGTSAEMQEWDCDDGSELAYGSTRDEACSSPRLFYCNGRSSRAFGPDKRTACSKEEKEWKCSDEGWSKGSNETSACERENKLYDCDDGSSNWGTSKKEVCEDDSIRWWKCGDSSAGYGRSMDEVCSREELLWYCSDGEQVVGKSREEACEDHGGFGGDVGVSSVEREEELSDLVQNVNAAEEKDNLDPGVYNIKGKKITTKTLNIRNSGPIRLFYDKNENGKRDPGEKYLTDKQAKKITYSVSKVSEVTNYSLSVGWNTMSFPTLMQGDNTSNIESASQLLGELNKQGAKVTHITTYRNGKFYIYTQRSDNSGKTISFNPDFNLVPGEGYFIKNYKDSVISLRGREYKGSVPLVMNNGWNLVGIYNQNKENYTAFEVLKQIQSNNIKGDILSRWESGRYKNLIYEDNKTFGADFKVYRNRGYWIRVRGSGGVYEPE